MINPSEVHLDWITLHLVSFEVSDRSVSVGFMPGVKLSLI